MNIKALHMYKSRLYPILVLDRMLSHRVRHLANTAIIWVLVFLVILVLLLYFARSFPLVGTELLLPLTAYLPNVIGLSLVILSIFLFIYLLELFFRYSYFRERTIAWRTRGQNHVADLMSFAVLKILYSVRRGDVTEAFLLSHEGETILLRAGLVKEKQKIFISQRVRILFENNLLPKSGEIFDLRDFSKFLFESDEEFRNFLFESNIRENDLLGASSWVMRDEEVRKSNERWWDRESLSKVQGIGKDWAYGEAYTLRKYSQEVVEDYDLHAGVLSIKDERDVREIERVLARGSGANAILVGEKGGGTLDIVYDFAKKIRSGSISPQLEHKKIFILNTDSLTSSVNGKEEIERLILTILSEATRSGNVIIVIPDFPSWIQSSLGLGADVVNIIDPFLESSKIQVIAISGNEAFHDTLEQNTTLMARFEKVLVSDPSNDEMIEILERAAEDVESRERVFFSYPAIEEILSGSQNYFPDGVLPDKAIDLLMEVVPRAVNQKEPFITRNDVLALITQKTNIPLGELSTKERAKLLDLEGFLHERVVGQNEAVKLVSEAMRRARVGVRNMKRPIGSFLFLGPTGVGKTETAKALAEAFFGSEDALIRFDMSEYQTSDALERLIGFFEGNRVGTLTKFLKEKSFGVLLLDEFEKTNKEVLDLFLQIFDEGFFSDMRGKRVSARNMIIIATSNAGSDIIWDAVKNGKDLSKMKREVVDALIQKGVYKPELLNRFDATVLFHPLNNEHLEQIAKLMLLKLQKRLREKNLDLVITDELVRAIVRHGTDTSFGARPMNRAIQEKVEQLVAEKFIRGEIKEGSQVVIQPEEIK